MFDNSSFDDRDFIKIPFLDNAYGVPERDFDTAFSFSKHVIIRKITDVKIISEPKKLSNGHRSGIVLILNGHT